MINSGSKYKRKIIHDQDGHMDVYSVLAMFDVRCPARQHAIKKLLCAGLRNKGSAMDDLQEAHDAVFRAIEMASAVDLVDVVDEEFEASEYLKVPENIRSNGDETPFYYPEYDGKYRIHLGDRVQMGDISGRIGVTLSRLLSIVTWNQEIIDIRKKDLSRLVIEHHDNSPFDPWDTGGR